ncbi:MAG: TIGR00296 family protein [Thermoplasmata archaeon]
MWSQDEGEVSVRLARWSLEVHAGREVGDRPTLPDSFARPGRVFVTLNIYPEATLRGCIGYYESIVPLGEAIERAAVAACHDPRFEPLRPEEADGVVVEVSLLTSPERVNAVRPSEYLDRFDVGVHGLLVRQGVASGLLLPQVALDHDWDPDEFLAQTCMKAGLLPDAWFEPSTQVYRFQAEVLREVEPRGGVARRVLNTVHDGHRG